MGRPRDVAELLQEGLDPGQIAQRLGISFNSVRQYLWVSVGEGLIRRSDVLFSLPKELRLAVERAVHAEGCRDLHAVQRWLYQKKVPYQQAELEMLWKLTSIRAGHGDLYEFITGTERLLHERIKEVLVARFGAEEGGWWRQGVPEKVRVNCAENRERDSDGDAEPYAYTTFIQLSEILDKQWALFQERLPKEVVTDKKVMLKDLARLNGIRNRVMHPTRLHKITDEDFEFAREMHRRLRAEAWRTPGSAGQLQPGPIA